MSQLSRPTHFPPPEHADSDGLLLVGGQLLTAWLLDAYRHGIFPWPIGEDEMFLAWWSPDPRAILEYDSLAISRRLQRTIQGSRFEATCNRDFCGVIEGCATAQRRRGNTWLVPAVVDAYRELHRQGLAHSVEVWHEGRLAGGVYGVSIGGYFSAESKFYYHRDASKVALAYLVRHVQARGYRLLDVQQMTPHMRRLGATEIPRGDFLKRLHQVRNQSVTFGEILESA